MLVDAILRISILIYASVAGSTCAILGTLNYERVRYHGANDDSFGAHARSLIDGTRLRVCLFCVWVFFVKSQVPQ